MDMSDFPRHMGEFIVSGAQCANNFHISIWQLSPMPLNLTYAGPRVIFLYYTILGNIPNAIYNQGV